MRPVLFCVGGLSLLTGPLITALSTLAAYAYFRRVRERTGLSEDELWDLMLPLAGGVVAGGLLLHFFLYGGGPASNLKALLSRRNPGGAFFGNFWGGVLALWIYSRRSRIDLRRAADAYACAAMLGLGLKRLGCVMNGCCYGKPTDLPWAIVFSDPRSQTPRRWLGTPLHPTQMYESVAALLIFVLLHRWMASRDEGDGPAPGTVFVAGTAAYSAFRLLSEPLRGSDPGLIRTLSLDTGQWTALAGLSVCAFLWLRWRARPC